MCVRACPFYNHVYVSVCVCLRVLVGHLCQRLKDKILLACICECVCPCALCAADESVSLLSCLPCHYNYKGHLTLKPHSLSPRLHIWPVFLL